MLQTEAEIPHNLIENPLLTLPVLPEVHPMDTAQPVYYRSRIMAVHGGDNLLLGASAVLLTLISWLRFSTLENFYSVSHHFVHEMLSFETQAQNHGYNPETIRVARYALCATLDEAVSKQFQQSAPTWEQENLLSRFEGEVSGDERFFLILERLVDNPKRHIHLLELIYVCLSLGYEGQFKNDPTGRIALDAIMDKLYHLIYQEKGETPITLWSGITNKQAIVQQRKKHYYFSKKILLGLTVLILSGFYVGFNTMLTIRSIPIEKFLQDITRNTQPFVS